MIDRMLDVGARFANRFLPWIRTTTLRSEPPACAPLSDDPLPDGRAPTAIYVEDAPEWSALTGTGSVQRWLEKVRTTLACEHENRNWQLTGHAAVIEHKYPSIGIELARRISADLALPLVEIGAGELDRLPSWYGALEGTAPLVLYIEQGPWQLDDDEETASDSASVMRSNIVGQLCRFNPASPLIWITTTTSLDDMAPELLRVGVFDRQFVLPPLTSEVEGRTFVDMVGQDRCAPSITKSINKVGKLMGSNYGTTEDRRLAALALQRKHMEIGRHLEFLDLIELNAHGVAEAERSSEEPNEVRRYIAMHEAGHATVAIIDSGGSNVPEYTCIHPSGNNRGIMLDSVSYVFAHDCVRTYIRFRHSIRVSLGGRAAEELIYGSGGISSGCRIDLENCTRRVSKAIAYWGFAPGMDASNMSATNLAVVVGKPSSTEQDHVERLTREFLYHEYVAVLGMLSNNRPLLETIAENLEAHMVLDQADMVRICEATGIRLEKQLLAA